MTTETKIQDHVEQTPEKRRLQLIDPSLFLAILCYVISAMTSQNLNLDKACRVNLNLTDEICDSLRNQDLDSENDFERQTQAIVTRALTWKTYLSASLPSIVALFAGYFSDKTGHRKFLMMISITGQTLIGINNILHVYFFKYLTVEALVFSEAILEGLSGSITLSTLTAFAYISSVTTNKTRTMRLGITAFCATSALPIGMGISGLLLSYSGYYACYGLTATVNLLNLLYLAFVFKDLKRTKEQKKHDRKGFCYLFKQFFNFANVKNTFSVIVRNTPNNRRLRLGLSLFTVSVLFGPVSGEGAVLYMSTRYRYGWDEVKYSEYQMYNFVMNCIGTVFSLVVISRYLKWHDSILGLMSSVSKIIAAFVYCFAASDIIFFYIGPVADILSGVSLLAMRSIISKLVETDELGQINTLTGLVENLIPLIFVPLYTQVYRATLQVLPGAVFLLGAGLAIPAMAVLLWLFYDHRSHISKSEIVDVKNSTA